ncbi:MAG: hypothetical protein JXA33_02810 [Anaerolineae bacterium]|nr:hypothetical protein [Anaerolineae bacterium]
MIHRAHFNPHILELIVVTGAAARLQNAAAASILLTLSGIGSRFLLTSIITLSIRTLPNLANGDWAGY